MLWTACPHGKATDGKLRVSVHVGPQLFPTNNAVSKLAEFPDWQYWPATKVSFKVKIGAHAYDAEIVSAPTSLSLWQALFAFDHGRPLRVLEPDLLPALQLPGRVRRPILPENLRGIGEHGARRGLASFRLLTSEAGLGVLPHDSRELYDGIETVKAKFPKGGGPIPPGKGPEPSSDLTQAYLFLQPLTTPVKGQSYSTTPPPAVPQFDFHQAVSLLGRHPALLRLFGGFGHQLELHVAERA